MFTRRSFILLSSIAPFLFSKSSLAQDKAAKPSKFKFPVTVSTWDSGITANNGAWPILQKGGLAIDAAEAAGIATENEPSCCVGLNAYPDRDGHVTLDSCIMNGNGDCGAVSYLERIKHPVSVARDVMEKTPHVLLSGKGAQEFAVTHGHKLETEKLSPDAEKEWKQWLEKSNYKPVINIENRKPGGTVSHVAVPYYFDDGTPNHDTMGTILMDSRNRLAGMVTTSGMAFKMHGRVGDSPIIGAGLYVDNEVGAATSSGVGEEVIRICGSHTVVEQMRHGKTPDEACREAIRRIIKHNGEKAREIQVGFIALSKTGEIGAFATHPGFTYSITNADHPQGKIFRAESHFDKSINDLLKEKSELLTK